MYTLKDIAIIIATYNRSEDLGETFKKCSNELLKAGEILIIDQSKDNKTEKIISKIKERKIRYFHIKKPSLTSARNFGVKVANKNSKILVFIDDDSTLFTGYLNGILEIFNKFPEANGVSGFQKNFGKNIFDRIYRRVFFIENGMVNNANVYSAYGPVYPSKLDHIIKSMWLTGHNMAYKREVFEKYKIRFDEKLGGYALGEDFDFSYGLWKLNRDGLYITPKAKMIHRFSKTSRTPSKKLIYMNQINHFYFNYKLFNSSVYEKFIFVWALTGIVIAQILNLITSPTSSKFEVVKNFFRSLFFCICKKGKIKEGKLEELYEELKL